MIKRGIQIDIPGFGILRLKAMCSDYTGTLSYRGQLVSGVRERLCDLSERVDICIVTSDARKTAREQLRGLPVTLEDEIPANRHDEFKRDYVKKLGLSLDQVVVFGNGRNDGLWLKAVRDARCALGARRARPQCIVWLCPVQCASGSGRTWMCTARGFEPLPPSLSHGVRSPFVLHSPRPFQPAFGSSMRPSRPLAKKLSG